MKYTKELTEKTMTTFAPQYEKEGKTITEADAEEILYNLTEYFKLLIEADRKKETQK